MDYALSSLASRRNSWICHCEALRSPANCYDLSVTTEHESFPRGDFQVNARFLPRRRLLRRRRLLAMTVSIFFPSEPESHGVKATIHNVIPGARRKPAAQKSGGLSGAALATGSLRDYQSALSMPAPWPCRYKRGQAKCSRQRSVMLPPKRHCFMRPTGVTCKKYLSPINFIFANL
jgi:hypothetical protein